MTGIRAIRNAIFLILFGLLLIGSVIHRERIHGWWQSLSETAGEELAQIERTAIEAVSHTVEKATERIVNTPPPLAVYTEGGADAHLSIAGTISWSNKQRRDNGLLSLTENPALTAAAEAKASDMLERQYFDHTSPTGEGPDDLARDAGYAYITIGENLALGNFNNDEALVQAWMDSPGHRANILNTEYTEIGVAVVRGTYEGEETWVAVQEFGRPASSCPSPGEPDRDRIAASEHSLDELRAELTEQKQALDTARRERDYVKYDRLVDEYNENVRRYNVFAEETRKLIEQFNATVRAYNACVGE